PLTTLAPGAGPVLSAAFSPSGDRVITATQTRTVQVWDAWHGGLLLSLSDDDGPVALFSPDGARVLTAGSARKVTEAPAARIWDARSGKLLFLLDDRSGAASSAAF